MDNSWDQDIQNQGSSGGDSSDCPLIEKTPEASVVKYQRMWSLSLIREVYEYTKSYCREANKIIETLDLEDYTKIASRFSKEPSEVMKKVREVLISGTLKSGKWCSTEDQLMKSLLDEGMPWKDIAVRLNSQIHGGQKMRNIKQCQERWNNHLNPLMKKGNWTVQEDLEILRLFKIHDRKWTIIANLVENRTSNSVKNRINSLIMKEKQAIDTKDTSNLTDLIIRNLERALEDTRLKVKYLDR